MVQISHHPQAATLLAFAAAALDEAAATVVACHLEACGDCRTTVRAAEAVGGAILDTAPADQPRAGALEKLLQRLDKGPEPQPPADGRGIPGSDLPAPLASRLGVPLSEIRWRRLGAGMATFDVPLSGAAASRLKLIRIAPGRALPVHGHGGSELTLILSGSYVDKFGRFQAGDVADLDDDVEHQPVVDSREDCICLAAVEAPTRFKGVLARLVQPLVGI